VGKDTYKLCCAPKMLQGKTFIMRDTTNRPESPDCRKQFGEMRSQIAKRWVMISVLFLGAIPVFYFSDRFLANFAIIPILIYGLLYGTAVLSLLDFSCPNCGKSLYVMVYFGKVPIIVKTWVSQTCTHCGARLK
jgi:hypothetical protein